MEDIDWDKVVAILKDGGVLFINHEDAKKIDIEELEQCGVNTKIDYTGMIEKGKMIAASVSGSRYGERSIIFTDKGQG